MAEPLFLLTGAILSACCRFEISVQDLKTIVRISINFCIPEFDQITIGKLIKFARKSMQNSCHSWSSLLKLRSKFWFLHFFGLRSSKLPHLVLNGRSRDAFGTPPDRAGDAPGRPRALLGRPGTPQEGPRTDFWSILGAPRTKIASNFIKVSTEIRSYFDGNSIKDRPKIDQDWIEVRSKFDSDQKS